MHTVIRHTETDDGFVVVISGKASDEIAAVIQEYRAYGHGHTTMETERSFTDERDAVRHFDNYYG